MTYTPRRKATVDWAYGVTTVPQRFDITLPKTLESLRRAGFDKPRLFIDGTDTERSQWPIQDYDKTVRDPATRGFGNWVLALWELYIRYPKAHRYALFQDDLITYRNLKEYLSRCEYPEEGYWNLYTVEQNEKLIPQQVKENKGWTLSNQMGRGAVALVFSREALTTLLKQDAIVKKPQDANKGYRSIDGAVINAFKPLGWKEYVHYPSLVQHTGTEFSTLNNTGKSFMLSPCFEGEHVDATEFLKCSQETGSSAP